MRRVILVMTILLTVCLSVCCMEIPCHAENAEDELRASLAPDAMGIPDDIADLLESEGITAEDPESVLTLSPEHFLSGIWQTVKTELTAPLRLLTGLLSLTLLTALFTGTGDAVSARMKRLPELICTLVCAGIAVRPAADALARTAQTLADGRMLMAGFVPVFTGFLAAGGSPAGAASYHVLMLFLTEAVMQLTVTVLMPLLQMAAAVGIVDAVNPSLKLGGLGAGLKKGVTWSLGTLMALFSALLSIRSFVASAADSMLSKTVRMLSSGLIPIVGSAVSDAYGTVQGSIHLLRNGAGAVGILALLWLTLPPLISVGLYRLLFVVCRICADMLEAKSLSALFKNTEQVLAAAFAMLVCFAVMLIFSTALMLLLMK